MKKNITLKINISGIVQGVGFRPFIYNLAHKYKIRGYVLNNSDGVEIICQGEKKSTTGFLKSIETKPPPKSRVDNISVLEQKSSKKYPAFSIKEIKKGKMRNAQISPDITLCDDCRKELFDKSNRRYYYPFINCTNCGPRYTIVKDVPYDRINTTMSDFIMCKECQDEYDDPSDRRFHAQPNACHVCGPYLTLLDNSNKMIIEAQNSNSTHKLFEKTAILLKNGEIIAIKGIGGYHLVCDATKENVVSDLRNKKLRRERPFAIMVKNISDIRKIAYLSKEEKTRIKLADRPIVLLKKKKSDIALSVSPNNDYLGIMLPYTPIQYLIFNHIDFPLVMTSANISEEPIIYKDKIAVEKLKNIASFFITGSRDINIYCDDSVTRFYDNNEYIIRRSRGIAPDPVKLNEKLKHQVLALGAEQKNTICGIKNNLAFLSQHIGDLKNLESFLTFKKTVKHICNIFDVKPEIIAYDIHPQYLNTQFALNIPDDFSEYKGIPVIGIQHHHAHAVSCMTENSVNDDVISIVLDGTGFGSDGTLWGGEILVATKKDFKRTAAFKPVMLPGGEISIKNIWRMGLSYIYEVFREDWMQHIPEKMSDTVSKDQMQMAIHQIKKGYNSILTTSCGRLFDGASAIAGLRNTVDYEGQAAVEFEQLIKHDEGHGYKFSIEHKNDLYYISWHNMIVELLNDIKANTPINKISYKFHAGLVNILHKAATFISNDTGIKVICLSGGCFMNMFLLKELVKKLQENKFRVITHSKVPCNDGGISLGQAIIAYNKFKG